MEQIARPAGSVAALPSGTGQPWLMRNAYREMLTPRMFRQVLAALGTIIAVFTVIGPVSTYETLTTLRRLGYWSLCYFVAWPVFFCMSVITLYLLRHRSPRAVSLSVAGMTLVAAVPATGVVCSIEHLMRPQYMVGLPTLYARVVAVMLPATVLVHLMLLQRVRLAGNRAAGDRLARPPAADTGRAYPRAIAAAGHAPASTATAGLATDSVPQPAARPETPPATKPRSVFDRLPRRLGSDLIYLTVDDHYVKAHTAAGSAIVLMRFADAVAELSEHGLQVHRSYWVANRYLQRLVQKEGRTLLRLTTGQEVPVSRTYLTAVRAALRDLED